MAAVTGEEMRHCGRFSKQGIQIVINPRKCGSWFRKRLIDEQPEQFTEDLKFMVTKSSGERTKIFVGVYDCPDGGAAALGEYPLGAGGALTTGACLVGAGG